MVKHDKLRHESRAASIVGKSRGVAVHQATTPGTSDRVGSNIEPGHSALFLLVERWTEDKVMDEIRDLDTKVLQTFSQEDEAKLKAAPGAEE